MKKLTVFILSILVYGFSLFAQEKEIELNMLPQSVKQLAQQYVDIMQNSKHVTEFINKLEKANICGALYANEDGTLTEQGKFMAKKDFEIKNQIISPIEVVKVMHLESNILNKPSDEY